MGDAESYACGLGGAKVELETGGVLTVVLAGELDLEAGLWLGQTLRRMLAGGDNIRTFWDMGELAGYHTTVRKEATSALRDHLAHISEIHALVTSTIVRMGVSVASLALGNIKTYTERSAFDAVYQASLNRVRATR